MSVAAANESEPERARHSADRALEVFERTDDGPGRAAAVMQLGYLAHDHARLREARALLERALELWRAFTPYLGFCPPVLVDLAGVDLGLGEPGRRPARLRQAIDALEVIGDRAGVSRCQQMLTETIPA
jgi:hypothetical protein